MIGIVKAEGAFVNACPPKLPSTSKGELRLMWKQHPDIPFPADDKAIIWRFMDFPAFVDLLQSSSLHFSRLDALGDPFEGYGTAMDYLKFKLPEQIFRASGGALGQAHDKLEQWRAQQARDYEQNQMLALVKRIQVAETCWANCWHLIEQESVALWKIYHGRNKPIAVLSTVGGLRDSIHSGGADNISIGVVQYSEKTLRTPMSSAVQAVTKTKAFAFENELRAVLIPGPAEQVMLGTGTKISIDLQSLVAAVRLSPVAEPWHVELVQQLIEHYGLQRLCEQSPLFAHPEFVPSVA
jgi:hypothetical protein